jgi:hypothetical protein
VFEQGNASEKIPMLETSSFIVDTSRDEELTKKVFGDLNRDILGPPRDGKVIVLYDSDNDEEAQEEKAAEIESTATPASADDTPAEARIDNSNDQRPNKEVDGSNNSGRSTSDP